MGTHTDPLAPRLSLGPGPAGWWAAHSGASLTCPSGQNWPREVCPYSFLAPLSRV